MQRVNIIDATEHLSELMDAASKGETVLIVNEQQETIVQLVPVTLGMIDMARTMPKFGSAAGLVWMSDDFDAPLDDFADYQ